MELLQELFDTDLGLPATEPAADRAPDMRMAGYVVLLDGEGRIAMLRTPRDGMLRLPGGLIQSRENQFSSLHPLVIRDVGIQADIRGDVGMVIEYRYRLPVVQISWCWYGHVEAESAAPAGHRPPDDPEGGPCELEWISFADAQRQLAAVQPLQYGSHFTRARDRTFLSAADRSLNRAGLSSCGSLDEACSHIDRIDRQLIRLLAERRTFASQADRFLAAEDVCAGPDLQACVDRIRHMARNEGFDPGAAVSIFNEILKGSPR